MQNNIMVEKSEETGVNTVVPLYYGQRNSHFYCTCSRRVPFPQSCRIFMGEKSILSFMLELVHSIYVILSF